MKYTPPIVDGKVQWVPIVVKSKDYLVGYISGFHLLKNIVLDSLEENGIKIDLRGIDLCLDSSRFNDVLENGKRESECSDTEIKEYFRSIIQHKIAMVKEKHPDNDTSILNECFLEIDCPCGLGVYMIKTPKQIPETPMKCKVCGNILIDYTDKYDDEIDFDGSVRKRNEKIINEINKTFEEEVQKERANDNEDFEGDEEYDN
jgi:hypothetical protein